MSPLGKFLLQNCFVGIGGQLYMSFTMIGYFCTDKRKQWKFANLRERQGFDQLVIVHTKRTQ